MHTPDGPAVSFPGIRVNLSPMKLSALALILAAALSFVACGDDDDETTASSTSSTTETTADTGSTGATGADGAEAERCPGADSPPNITSVTAYGADCADVEAAMAKIGSISTSFELGDFSCERTEGGELAGTWRCDGADGYFTFEFAD